MSRSGLAYLNLFGRVSTVVIYLPTPSRCSFITTSRLLSVTQWTFCSMLNSHTTFFRETNEKKEMERKYMFLNEQKWINITTDKGDGNRERLQQLIGDTTDKRREKNGVLLKGSSSALCLEGTSMCLDALSGLPSHVRRHCPPTTHSLITLGNLSKGRQSKS